MKQGWLAGPWPWIAALSVGGFVLISCGGGNGPVAPPQPDEQNPQVLAGDEVLANFDTNQLEKFLRRHGIVP